MSSRNQPNLDPRLLPPGVDVDNNAGPSFSNLNYGPDQQRNSFMQGNPYFDNHAASNGEEAEGGDQQDEDFSAEDTLQHSPNNDDSKRPRACEACRGLKVRCDQDPNTPDRPCKRCAKANRQCIITQPTRKRQKKADNRVADLEKKLDALTAVLHAQQSGTSTRLDTYDRGSTSRGSLEMQTPQIHPSLARSNDSPSFRRPDTQVPERPSSYPPPASELPPNKRRRVDEDQQDLQHPQRQTEAPENQRDLSWSATLKAEDDRFHSLRGNTKRQLYHIAPEAIIARINDLVDPALHRQIFHKYVHELAPSLPAVVFAPGTTAQQVLEQKPVLFMVILAIAGIGDMSAETHDELATEIVSIYADCTIRSGVKSVELIQALHLSVMWFRPPRRPQEANFYQFVHMAACMALELGLGRRFNLVKVKRGFGGPGNDCPPGKLTAAVDSDSLESRRAWLSCYYLCASTAMVLRRPNLLRWTNYMQECIDVLESSPEAFASDRLFTEQVKIQKICEEISNAFLMDDASATTISMTDPKVSYTLDIYEQKLKDWEDRLPMGFKAKPQLMYFREIASLYLHEIALHVDHNVDDFRMPFTEHSLRSAVYSDTLSQKQMAALESCLQAAQGALNIYLDFGYDVINRLPQLLFFVRTVYALIVLIKMHTAVTTPGSELGKIIKVEDLKVEHYLERLHQLFSDLNTKGLIRPHSKVIMIIGILREWFLKNKNGIATDKEASDKSVPHGRNPHGPGGESKLQVLSEAATAKSSSSTGRQSGKPISQQSAGNQSWTCEYPTPIAYPQGNFGVGGQSSSATPSETWASNRLETGSTVSSQTPAPSAGMYPSTPGLSANYNDNFSNILTPNSGGDNFDWAAGLDLEQVLDGAFRDIDMSGDLGGWFIGDNIATFPMATDGTQ